MAKNAQKPQHKIYAEKGTVHGVQTSTTREFSSGGFVSTNDEAHKRSGAPLHYKKTQKMKCGGPS